MNFGHSYWFKPPAAGEGNGGGNDYVTITVDETLSIVTDELDASYKYVVIDTSTTDAFTVTDAGTSSGSDTIEVYCIGGGGGGGQATSGSLVGGGGGAGAGGYIRDLSFNNGSTGLAQTYSVTVGGGGTGGGGGNQTNGGDSQVYDTVSRSTDFDGSSDYLSIPTSADWTIGSGDYTVEMWIKTTDTQGELISAFNDASPYEGWLFGVGFLGNAGKLEVYFAVDMDSEYYESNTAVNDGEWHHVAFTKSGTTLRFFLDGEADGEEELMIDSTSSGQDILIGAANNSTPNRYFDGLMSNIRVVKGTALYTAAFTPPFSNLTAVTNTKLLIQPNTDQSAWTDESSSPHTISATGLSWSTDLSTDTSTMRAFGGGAGGNYGSTWADGSAGGSGGGGSYSPNTPGKGFRGQGYAGGAGTYSAPYNNGGGGGAGEVGDSDTNPCNGGDGIQIEWMDDMNAMLGPDGDGYFAGGGGGANGSSTLGSAGQGGQGGGGDQVLNSYGGDGEVNSGGGGAGGRNTAAGGAGGTGKVMIRWKASA